MDKILAIINITMFIALFLGGIYAKKTGELHCNKNGIIALVIVFILPICLGIRVLM
ncbi:hypothetical protein [Clostridium botulinum]|uniref:hypothetical protein n=1 Tax=Clostridium botulinum TaxID=1491 RepID=UPI001C9AD778|nr:hypothetical protein [Clostridium botulinum]MBY6809022.1 hypothetical protein [Clostridium botulinum]MBY6822273.1 hypothetical protein [Clostridium botulinum]MBY6832937.1 hypothetical protein [Clostridium botulinum]MBY6972165.1 hypothetical protein [Clostridium botulinum]HBJ1649400.1 hypothetical protein [Clostridium botulinum]